MIPWDNTAKPSGQKNACTLPRDTKILWFPWDYEKIKLLEAEKKIEKEMAAAEKSLELMKNARKNLLRLFPIILRGDVLFWVAS